MATAMPTLPPIEDLPNLESSQINEILDLLFEPTPALHAMMPPLIKNTSHSPPKTYFEFTALVKSQLLPLADAAAAEDEARKTLDDVLAAHPRLGEKKVDSAMSRAEQAAMLAASPGAGASTAQRDPAEAEAEASTLLQLNREYEEAFPGLRYVVFVAGRSRPVIFENMRQRIARRDIHSERLEAINAMCDIADDRIKKLMA